jgi:hypothetical protein
VQAPSPRSSGPLASLIAVLHPQSEAVVLSATEAARSKAAAEEGGGGGSKKSRPKRGASGSTANGHHEQHEQPSAAVGAVVEQQLAAAVAAAAAATAAEEEEAAAAAEDPNAELRCAVALVVVPNPLGQPCIAQCALYRHARFFEQQCMPLTHPAVGPVLCSPAGGSGRHCWQRRPPAAPTPLCNCSWRRA